jgi:hypothetical protein
VVGRVRIHTDHLSRGDLTAAVSRAGLRGVWIDGCTEHGSRKRRRAFEVRLAAHPRPGRRRRNTGRYGAEDGFSPQYVAAATYDEHGAWIAELYALDADAIVGPYRNRADFHAQTQGHYRTEVNA